MGIKGLICGIISYRLVRRNEKGVPAPLPIFYYAGFTWEVIKMKICKIEECENNKIVIDEHRKYTWNEKTLNTDNPEVLKVDDHSVDALQYLVGTIELTLPTGCVIEGCENTHFGKGYCKEHFYKSNYHKAIQQRRRAKIKNCQINDFKSSDWEIILYEFEGRCAYCGDESETLHQEHVKPLHNGGNNTLSNVVPSCPRCNHSKGTKDVADWYKEQPFYDKEKFDAIIKHTKEKNLV